MIFLRPSCVVHCIVLIALSQELHKHLTSIVASIEYCMLLLGGGHPDCSGISYKTYCCLFEGNGKDVIVSNIDSQVGSGNNGADGRDWAPGFDCALETNASPIFNHAALL